MQQKIYLIVFLALCCAVTSCDVQKRLYRKGFYIERATDLLTSKTHKTEAPVSLENAAEEETDVITGTVVVADSTQTVAADSATDLSAGASADSASQKREPVLHRERVPEKPEVKGHTAAPIEKDRKQAMGAGIASAIFFILGMLGLIIKGTAGPVGIFIGAAFLCFILCMMLAAFLYPRDPVVKQPKDKVATSMDPVAKVGIGLLIFVFLVLLLVAFFFVSIFGGLFL